MHTLVISQQIHGSGTVCIMNRSRTNVGFCSFETKLAWHPYKDNGRPCYSVHVQ